MPGLRPYAWVWVIRSGMSDLQVRRHVSAEWDFSCTRRVHARTLADRATSFPSLISALVLTGLRQHKDTTTTTNWSSLAAGDELRASISSTIKIVWEIASWTPVVPGELPALLSGEYVWGWNVSAPWNWWRVNPLFVLYIYRVFPLSGKLEIFL